LSIEQGQFSRWRCLSSRPEVRVQAFHGSFSEARKNTQPDQAGDFLLSDDPVNEGGGPLGDSDLPGE
jgi:hypothetical protein